MLLGRDRELRELDRALDEAREGTSSVLALVGEPGSASRPCSTIWPVVPPGCASCGRAASSRRRMSRSPACSSFSGRRSARSAGSRGRRLPRSRARSHSARAPLQDRFAVGAATLSLLAAYAEESPLLVLVDDVHWLDGSSAEALLFAVRRLVADPIAVVLAVREDEPSLLDGAGLPLLQLEGLDREQAGVLLGAVSSEAAEHLYRATAGNPLALLELAHEAETVAASPLEQPLPISTSIARSFLRRSATLSEHARQGLVLAAASDTGDLTVLARAGLRVDDLAEAERCRPDPAGRRHSSSSAIRSRAPPSTERRRRSSAAPRTARSPTRCPTWTPIGARGTSRRRRPARTSPPRSALEQAAQRARERTAYSVSATAFERAARLNADDGRRGRLLYQAAESAWLAGQAGRARELLDEAALRAADPQIVSLRGEIAARRGPVSEGYELLVAAAADARPEDAVLMLAEAADAAFYSGAPDKMLAAAEQAAALVEAGADGKAPFYAAVALGTSRIMTGGDGAADLLRAVELYETGDFGDDPRALAWAALTAVFLRDAEAGRRLIDRSIATAREHTAIGVLPRLLNRLARDESMSDRWPEAEADFHEAIRLARETGQRSELAAALAGLAWFDGRRGREDDCREHAAESRALCVELGIGFYELWTYTALGELELGLGRPDAAASPLRGAGGSRRGARDRRRRHVACARARRLLSPSRAGRRRARRCRCTRSARTCQGPAVGARARRALPRVAGRRFSSRSSRQALTLHQQTLDAFETARTRLAYGARLRRARKRVRAREQLRAALEAFEALGPSPWADAAGVELAATGETARRRDPSTLGELTPQELQIALLLGDGKTTREAAASLFLSPKTIEYHLRSIYRKLDINSRDALAEAVVR